VIAGARHNDGEKAAWAEAHPTGLTPEYTTVWSFPMRGSWATHRPGYRGNFGPQVPRNVIEMYSEKGDVVLDPMVGAGTTLIEAKLLGRDGIGLDINPEAVGLAKKGLRFEHRPGSEQEVKVADARDLSFLGDESIDLVLTHPPYELYRVLRAGRYCAILIGDTRRGRHYVPLAFNVMRRFQRVGFILKEDIIKVQHNCAATERWRWKAKRDKFYLILPDNARAFVCFSEGRGGRGLLAAAVEPVS